MKTKRTKVLVNVTVQYDDEDSLKEAMKELKNELGFEMGSYGASGFYIKTGRVTEVK